MDRLDLARLSTARRICGYCPDMVPVVSGDEIWTVDITSDAYQAPAAGMSARDYVLNMEALGERLDLFKHEDCLVLGVPVPGGMPNPNWSRRALDLSMAYWSGDHSTKTREVMDFLLARGDEPFPRSGPFRPALKKEG